MKATRVCSVDDCATKVRVPSREMCSVHQARADRLGDPLAPRQHGRWTNDHVPGYVAAHQRVYAARGPARDHTCQCGALAEEWAYDGADPREIVGEWNSSRVAYSGSPAHYVPMCKRCHREEDKSRRVASLAGVDLNL